MRRKIVSCLLGGMMVLALAACSSKEDTQNQNNVTSENYSDYMTLGEYKGIEAEATTSLEVTEEEIQEQIDLALSTYAETEKVTEGTVKDGDTINLDFSGLLDGVAFSNGTATDYTYTVGGNFIEDLDRGLIGLEIGKEYEIPCKFPENYGKEELNGKDVIFVVTVNYVENEILPEFNDEFVKKMTEESDEVLYTTQEMRESIKNYLAEQKKLQYESEVYAQVMQAIIDTSEIKELPQAEVDNAFTLITQSAETDFNNYGALYGAETFEDFLVIAGFESVEKYEEEMRIYAEEYVKEKMVVSLISEAENIQITEEEIKTYAEDLATQVGYATVDELQAAYGETLFDDIRYELLYQQVYSIVVENAAIK